MRAIALLQGIERLQLAEQLLHFAGKFTFELHHPVSERPGSSGDKVADFRQKFRRDLLRPLAAKPSQQRTQETRFFAVLELVEDFREIGILDALFETAEQREDGGRAVLVEPCQEAVQRPLQCLLRLQTDPDDVARLHGGKVESGKRLLGFQHLRLAEHNGPRVHRYRRNGTFRWLASKEAGGRVDDCRFHDLILLNIHCLLDVRGVSLIAEAAKSQVDTILRVKRRALPYPPPALRPWPSR